MPHPPRFHDNCSPSITPLSAVMRSSLQLCGLVPPPSFLTIYRLAEEESQQRYVCEVTIVLWG